MRSLLAVALLFSAMGAVPSLWAQNELSKVELYGGYGYVRFNVHTNVIGQPPSQAFNANGGSGQIVYNVNDWLGVLGDVGGYWATSTTSQAAGAAIPYLFGPRLNFRRHAVTPFAQVLFGGVATSSGIETSGWQDHFAMTGGGGIDIKVSRQFSIRPVQIEYFMTKIPDGLSNQQNNFRFSAGVSLLIGRK